MTSSTSSSDRHSHKQTRVKAAPCSLCHSLGNLQESLATADDKAISFEQSARHGGDSSAPFAFELSRMYAAPKAVLFFVAGAKACIKPGSRHLTDHQSATICRYCSIARNICSANTQTSTITYRALSMSAEFQLSFDSRHWPNKRQKLKQHSRLGALPAAQTLEVAQLSEGLELPVQLIYLVSLLGFLVVGAYLVVRQVCVLCYTQQALTLGGLNQQQQHLASASCSTAQLQLYSKIVKMQQHLQ